MLKKLTLAAFAASTLLIGVPQQAAAVTYPECALNCTWISTDHNGGGYWICEVQMDCVNPA